MGRTSFDKKLKPAQHRELNDIIRTCRYKNHRLIVNHIKGKFKINTSITAVHRYMQQLRLKDIEWLSLYYVTNPEIIKRELDEHGFDYALKDTNGVLNAWLRSRKK
ncbi:TPA: hypothetical protein I8P16_004186 [Salmonella enterica subsp. enterica serovar Napoli]|nr:hypothetical protein [Salmonella enterica subsp. enterica serovar Napoli]